MLAFKQWAFSLCAAMVACGLARMLMPKSGMEKAFKMVVSVFFLCCMLSPAVLRDPGLTVEISGETRQEITELSGRISSVADRQALDIATKNLEQMIAGKLSQKGIKVHAITININTNGQNSPQALSADIVLDRVHEVQHGNLVRELESDLGFTVRLGYAESGEGE